MGRIQRNALWGVLWLSVGCGDGGTALPEAEEVSTGRPDAAPACSRQIVREVQYDQTAAAEHLNRLDVWPLPDGSAADPIVVFVHGGGWVSGDKATHEEFPNIAAFFADEGVAWVPIDYRLVDDPDSPGTTYAEQASDVAHAIAWVHEHAAEFCGDPSRIQLIGHWAGAHLVALVAADDRYLAEVGLSREVLRGVVALDVNAYDIPYAIEHGAEHDYPAAAVNLPRVFGDDLASQRDASPISHLPDAPLPPHLLVSAPIQGAGIVQSLSRAVTERYADALRARGTSATTFEAPGTTHSSLVTQLGSPNHPITEELATFLGQHAG